MIQSVQEGVQQITWKEYFAYAEGWDEEKKRYLGLRAGQVSVVLLDNRSLIIKPETALKQLEADKAQSQKVQIEGGTVVVEVPGGEITVKTVEPKEARKPRRFYGSVKLDAKRLGRDTGKIAEEVVQHLSTIVGSKVEVTLEINAEIPDGAPDNIVRTVTENCNTLHFTSHGFEEE